MVKDQPVMKHVNSATHTKPKHIQTFTAKGSPVKINTDIDPHTALKQIQPVGVIGQNPPTPVPPPPMPQYTVVQARILRRSGLIGKNPPTSDAPPPMPSALVVDVTVGSRFRRSTNLGLQDVPVMEFDGKVIITGKKGKIVKISSIIKPK